MHIWLFLGRFKRSLAVTNWPTSRFEGRWPCSRGILTFKLADRRRPKTVAHLRFVCREFQSQVESADFQWPLQIFSSVNGGGFYGLDLEDSIHYSLAKGDFRVHGGCELFGQKFLIGSSSSGFPSLRLILHRDSFFSIPLVGTSSRFPSR